MSDEQRVVIVTGGAQGIGLGISQAFAQQGDLVFIADIDEEAGIEAIALFEENSWNGRYVKVDVSQEDSVKALFAEVAPFGRLDVVVNNAGIFSHQPIADLDFATWNQVLGVNLSGPFLMSKYAQPLMQSGGGGVIINMASTRALMSEAHTEPYSASKGGIVALTHALAVSLGPSIRVNAISPGWIEVRDWQKKRAQSEPVHSQSDLSQHPVGRVGTPRDIAEACLYLASPGASFVTGQNLVIDGGMTVKMIYTE